MFGRWTRRRSAHVERAPVSGDLNEWVLSLPWVVERPSGAGRAGVRLFGIDCEPLHRRRAWLITGIPDTSSGAVNVTVAAVMPADPSLGVVMAGRDGHEVLRLAGDHTLVPTWLLPGGHVFVTPRGPAAHERRALETFLLQAYEHALS